MCRRKEKHKNKRQKQSTNIMTPCYCKISSIKQGSDTAEWTCHWFVTWFLNAFCNTKTSKQGDRLTIKPACPRSPLEFSFSCCLGHIHEVTRLTGFWFCRKKHPRPPVFCGVKSLLLTMHFNPSVNLKCLFSVAVVFIYTLVCVCKCLTCYSSWPAAVLFPSGLWGPPCLGKCQIHTEESQTSFDPSSGSLRTDSTDCWKKTKKKQQHCINRGQISIFN